MPQLLNLFLTIDKKKKKQYLSNNLNLQNNYDEQNNYLQRFLLLFQFQKFLLIM